LVLQAIIPNNTSIKNITRLIICEITKKATFFLLKKRTLTHEDYHCTAKLSYWQL
jgi:hypothetical protein